MRELTKQIFHIYSAQKAFPYILEGLRSKNNRTRIECVDLVGYLIDHHGAEVTMENFSLTIFSFFRILTCFQMVSTDWWTIKIFAGGCKLDSRA